MSLSISILQFHFQYSNFCLQYFKNIRFTLSFQKLRILRISSILTFHLSKRNLYKHTHSTTDPSTYHIPSLNNTGKHLRNVYLQIRTWKCTCCAKTDGSKRRRPLWRRTLCSRCTTRSWCSTCPRRTSRTWAW